MKDEETENRDETDAETSDGGGETINDPLTQGDVEAPRAKFEGRTPK